MTVTPRDRRRPLVFAAASAYPRGLGEVRRAYLRACALTAREQLDGIEAVDDPDELAARIGAAAAELAQAERELLWSWPG